MNIAAGKVVYLCAEVTSGSLEEAMKDYGELIKIPVYRNEYVDTYAEYEMKDFSDVSGIAVTSGISGERIKWLIDKLGESGEVPVYSIGPACSKKLVEAGVKENRIMKLVSIAIAGWWKRLRSQRGSRKRELDVRAERGTDEIQNWEAGGADWMLKQRKAWMKSKTRSWRAEYT